MQLSTQRESGSILFMILLAVVLFAALSYAVTSSLRGDGKSGAGESADAKAAALIQYGGLLENTIQRMRLSGNVPEWGFDFSDGTGPSGSTANASCTSADCRVFRNGSLQGQVDSQKFDESYIDSRWRTTNPTWGGGSGSATEIKFVGIAGIGTSYPEIVLVMQGMSAEICKAINRNLWKSEAYPTEAYGNGSNPIDYTSLMTSLPTTAYANFGDEAGNSYYYRNKKAGCVGRESLNYGGDFYYTLLER